MSEENPVRAIDSYVESLDLKGFGSGNTSDGVKPGQPAYDPRGLLKLYLYGYLRLGELYEQQGDYADAKSVYQSLPSQFPNRPDLIQQAKQRLAKLQSEGK